MSSPTLHRSAARPQPRSALTEVELIWIEKRYEQWIRFGRIATDRIINRRTRIVGFRPGATFDMQQDLTARAHEGQRRVGLAGRHGGDDIDAGVNRSEVVRQPAHKSEGCARTSPSMR